MELQVQWQSVESSDVKAVSYVPEQFMLMVDFHKTGVYTYFQVKPDVFAAFMVAPSKGAFVNKVFKQGNWAYQRGMPDAVLFVPEE